MKSVEYALYHGDKFIDLGTLDYLTKKLNLSESSIKYYATPSYHKKRPNGMYAFKLEDN